MKKLKYYINILLLPLAMMALLQACSKNNAKPSTNSDKSKLNLQIDSAQLLYTNAVEGKQAGDYATGSKATLEVAINLAKSVASGAFTQQEVNNATANLVRAEAAFQNNIILQISPTNLVAYWKFDGDLSDASGNGHTGTLQAGYTGSSVATIQNGNTLPVLTTDRYGNANSAYSFNNGAYVDVPYDASLRPASFTISAWIKPAASNAGNYIVSLDRWNGYKFQIQSNNFPYLTIMTDKGDLDVDDNPGSVQIGVWSQVVASYTNGTMKFYINGKLIKTVSENGNPIPLTSPVDLAIGNELPKADYNLTDSSSPNYFYGASYFMGSIDDVRIYNTVLTDSEVGSLYTMESPN